MKKGFHRLERTKDHIPEILHGLDLPHTRVGREQSLQKSYEKAENYLWHIVFYTTQLRQLGIRELDIWLMMTDPYWDAFEEFKDDSTFASYKKAARKLAERSARGEGHE